MGTTAADRTTASRPCSALWPMSPQGEFASPAPPIANTTTTNWCPFRGRAAQLRRALGAEQRSCEGTPVTNAHNHNELVPTQYLADALLCIGDPVEFALVVEVQRSINRDKVRSWPLYVHALFAKLGCPVELVVIATREDVASWARNRVQTTLRSHFEATVIGPSQVPSRFDIEGSGHRAPELLVLAAAMHGHGPSAEHIGRSAMEHLRSGYEFVACRP